MNPKFKIQHAKWLQPFDRTALALMLVLTILMALLVSSGDRAAPKVREFSWQDKQIGTEDNRFILTFTRPMNHTSVETNLLIEPLLPGKVSWAGRRMAYTLTAPAPYGTSYKVELQGARDSFSGKNDKGTLIERFTGSFKTRDRAFVYQGVEGEEQGRLILYNLTKQQKTVLTPNYLLVMDFKPFPDGDRILFSAADTRTQKKDLLDVQLYTVSTGLNLSSNGNQDAQPVAGRIDLVLDSKDYQNLKFDLSADGQTIVVMRVNRSKPAESGLWVIKIEGHQSGRPTAQPLENQPGGDFLITPDSTAVAIAQGQGVAILPLSPQAKPLDFLAKFAMVVAFAKDNSAAAMVKFNTNYTRSLFVVPNQAIKQGVEKKLLDTDGSVLGCQFDPQASILYCLLTQLLPGKEYQELPYLAAIDLNTNQIKPLLQFPQQRDIQMSLSPDGLALLFDQVIPAMTPPTPDSLRTNEGQAIATSRLWLLPLLSYGGKLQPEQLPLPGLHPRWMP